MNQFSLKDVTFVVNHLLGECRTHGYLSITSQSQVNHTNQEEVYVNINGTASLKYTDNIGLEKRYNSAEGIFLDKCNLGYGSGMTYALVSFGGGVTVDTERGLITCSFAMGFTVDKLFEMRRLILEDTFQDAVWT